MGSIINSKTCTCLWKDIDLLKRMCSQGHRYFHKHWVSNVKNYGSFPGTCVVDHTALIYAHGRGAEGYNTFHGPLELIPCLINSMLEEDHPFQVCGREMVPLAPEVIKQYIM